MKLKIIGIAGRARSGKDTIAKHLVNQHGFLRVGFADPIKDALAAMLRITPEMLERYKDEPFESLNTTPRKAMQTLGTEWGRNIIDTNVWIRMLQERIYNIATLAVYPKIVISDVRFDNEAQAIKSWGGTVWLVERIPEPNIVTVEHSSEWGINEELVTAWITNCVDDGSSLDALHYQADWCLERANSEVDYDALRKLFSGHHS